MTAYGAGEKQTAGAGAAKTAPGNALVASYYRSAEHLNLKPIAQRTYRSTIEPFREQHGDKVTAKLKQEHVKAIIAKPASRPAVANNWLKAIKILMRHAIDSGVRADDPTLGVKKLRTGPSGYRTWSEEEIEQFYDRHPIGSRADWRWTFCFTPGNAGPMWFAWAANTFGAPTGRASACRRASTARDAAYSLKHSWLSNCSADSSSGNGLLIAARLQSRRSGLPA